MPFIHERPNWPRFTWDGEALSPALSALRHRQGRLIGCMRGLGFELRQEARLGTLSDDVVKSSAIEDKRLDADEVRSSIARRLGLDGGGLAPANRDVEGIVEMTLDATQRFAEPLSAERLFGWHAALFPTGRSGMRHITVGAWRSQEAGKMQVVSGPTARQRLHFQAPAAERLDGEMNGFLEWFNGADATDPVLRAGIAHFWFLSIHPFEDGNGRLARAIADMALARADGSGERFCSMSSQLEAERAAYYDQLESQQRGELDITAWLRWFLDCLGRAVDSAEQALEAVLYKARLWEQLSHRPVNERQRSVINRMLNRWEGHLNTSQYAQLAKCSNDTALRDISRLLSGGILMQNPGGGRSTSYRLATAAELV